jgi:hypothetical protein
MFMRFFQRTLPLVNHSAPDDFAAQSAESPARIWSGIDQPRQKQTIEVTLGKEAVSRWTPFNGRNQSPVHIEAERVWVDPNSAGKVGGAEEFRHR